MVEQCVGESLPRPLEMSWKSQGIWFGLEGGHHVYRTTAVVAAR